MNYKKIEQYVIYFADPMTPHGNYHHILLLLDIQNGNYSV